MNFPDEQDLFPEQVSGLLIWRFRILIIRISEFIGMSGGGSYRDFYLAKVQCRVRDMDSAAQPCQERLRHTLNP